MTMTRTCATETSEGEAGEGQVGGGGAMTASCGLDDTCMRWAHTI